MSKADVSHEEDFLGHTFGCDIPEQENLDDKDTQAIQDAETWVTSQNLDPEVSKSLMARLNLIKVTAIEMK